MPKSNKTINLAYSVGFFYSNKKMNLVREISENTFLKNGGHNDYRDLTN